MTRFIPKKFAENSNNSGVFGSFQEQGGNVGDGTLSSDPDTLQGGSAWPLGWSAATNSFLQIPRGEEIEGVERVFSAAIVQQFIDGITFWQPEMPVIQYQTIVQYQTDSDLPKIFVNITGTNTATAPDTDTTNWLMVLDFGSSFANVDLSNLSETGQAIIDSKANVDLSNSTVITNCLTSVPQNINLEFSNGTFTLKAGSKVYDGNGLFKAISSDISLTPSGYVDTPHVLIVKNDGTLYARAVVDCSSGATIPSTDTWLHFNTTDKKLYIINAGVNVGTASFPLCAFNVSGGKASSVSLTFNYIGYIGNTIFALQNLRGMRPNGFNLDGTLNNVEFQVNSILTTTFTSGYTGYIVINSGLLAGWNVNNGRYNPDKNVNEYDGVKSDVSIVGTFSTDSTGRIISFNPKLPFQAVDASDYRSLAGIDSNIDYIIESARNGKSWYAKYRSGKLEQGGNVSSQTPVVYLKPFKNTNYQIVLGQSGSSQSGTVGRTTWTEKTTTGFTPSFVTETDWFATGEGA